MGAGAGAELDTGAAPGTETVCPEAARAARDGGEGACRLIGTRGAASAVGAAAAAAAAAARLGGAGASAGDGLGNGLGDGLVAGPRAFKRASAAAASTARETGTGAAAAAAAAAGDATVAEAGSGFEWARWSCGAAGGGGPASGACTRHRQAR